MKRTLQALLFLILASRAVATDLPIAYTLDADGPVSLAVYDASGKLVLTLLTGAQRAAGSHTETWDGRDRYGVAQPAGSYTWKLLQGGGLRAEIITYIGATVKPLSGRPPGNVPTDFLGIYDLNTDGLVTTNEWVPGFIGEVGPRRTPPHAPSDAPGRVAARWNPCSDSAAIQPSTTAGNASNPEHRGDCG